MPLICPQLIKRPRMIRETAHNATAVKGKNPMLKLMQVVNIAPFVRRDQISNAISFEWVVISSQ